MQFRQYVHKKYLKTKYLPLAAIAAIIALALASLIAGYTSAHYLVINADTTISIYLFSSPFGPHDVLLADWHSSLLKMPLLVLQAVLPLNMRTFELFSAAYVFFMGLGWAIAGSMILGKKVFLPLCILMAVMITGSLTLPVETAFGTARNLEYPLFLISIFLLWKACKAYEKRRAFTQKPVLVPLFAYLFIAGVLGASDPYFSVIGLVSIAIQCSLALYLKIYDRSSVFLVFFGALAGYVVSKIIITLAMAIGLFSYYGEDIRPQLHSFDQIPPHVWEAVHALLALVGGDVFGATITTDLYGKAIMLLLFVALSVAMVQRLKKIKPTIKKNPAYANVLISAMLVFALYSLLVGFEHQPRYIVLCVLILTLPLAEYISQMKITKTLKHRRLSMSLATGTLLLILGASTLNQFVASERYGYAVNSNNLQDIARYIDSQNINTLIAGHSYVSTVKFWSKPKIDYIPVLFCNQNLPFLTRKSWYTPKPYTSDNVILLVDHEGRDSGSWLCSDKQIFEYYGEPLASKTLPGVDNKTVTLYTYPKSIINKIRLIETKGIPVPKMH